MRARWSAPLAAALLMVGCISAPEGPSPSLSPSSTSPAPVSAGCPPGSLPDQPGDDSQARPALRDWYQLVAADPTAPRMLVGALDFAPEGSGQPTVQSLWAFSTCTNSWSQLPGGPLLTAGAAAPLAQLVADPADDRVLGLPVGLTPMWAYDPQRARWTRVDASGGGSAEAWPMAVTDGAGALLAFDPNTLAADPSASGVLAYDAARRAWTMLSLPQPGAGTPRVAMDSYDLAYDDSVHRLVLVITPQGAGDRPAQTWLFDPSAGTWARGADVPRALPGGYPSRGWAAAFDPVTEQTWWFGDSAMLGYDARADTWTAAARGPGWPAPLTVGGIEVDPIARLVDRMVHDPVNERFVVVGGWVRPAGEAPGGFVAVTDLLATDDVWAYSPAANHWTMLLAPSEAPASYGPG